MSTTNAPTARYDHTAVWTGSKMIIWGGLGAVGGNQVNDGGIYDPATNSWSIISTTNAPAGRVYHTAIWTGSKMILWGGLGAAGGYLNDGGVYDPADGPNGSWSPISMANAPTARAHHTAVWTGSKMIIWGGA